MHLFSQLTHTLHTRSICRQKDTGVQVYTPQEKKKSTYSRGGGRGVVGKWERNEEAPRRMNRETEGGGNKRKEPRDTVRRGAFVAARGRPSINGLEKACSRAEENGSRPRGFPLFLPVPETTAARRKRVYSCRCAWSVSRGSAEWRPLLTACVMRPVEKCFWGLGRIRWSYGRGVFSSGLANKREVQGGRRVDRHYLRVLLACYCSSGLSCLFRLISDGLFWSKVGK